MQLELFLRGGTALILRHLPLELVRILTRFRTPASMMASLACLADSKRFARCGGADSGRRTRLNFLYLRRKNRRASGLVAWGAGCSRERFPRMPPRN